MTILRVSSNSEAGSIAGAVAGAINKEHKCLLVGIGAAAVNQAVKAIVLAGNFYDDTFGRLAVEPFFETVEIDGREKTSVNFYVYDKTYYYKKVA